MTEPTTQVPASTVNALRQRTGVGFSKCKEALFLNANNVDEAERWLKVQGVKTDVLTRTTGEGALAIKTSEDGKKVALVELLCETDFAAKSERFLKLTDDIAAAVLKTPVGSVTEALGLKVGEEVLHQVLYREIGGIVKENLKLNHVTALNFTRRPGAIGTYLHSNKKLGVLVGIVTESEAHVARPEFQQLLKDIAVHVAGAPIPPQVVYSSDLPLTTIEAQKSLYQAQLAADPRNLKKPDAIKEKIIQGKLNSFYKDVALIEQAFVKDDSKTVRQLVEETSKAIGATITIDWFIRRTLGA